ncbi:DCC1-like thiol-disulfide oxidoreductase family protein [Nitrospira sp. NS4]|uniref:DCC1-like thiol-disulfide oxidoreductase family protein n=1 Tax=Nitrospira sp. NS4 TaxID=3414498 RepID=UPI003C2B53F1
MTDPPLPCPLDPRHPSLLIYDGRCRLCVTAKHGLDRAGLGEAGSGLRMIPYESEEAAGVLGDRYRPGPPAMAFLVHPSGEVSQGLNAFLPLLPGLPGGRVLRWILRWAFVRALAGRVYGWVARYRYRFFGSVVPPDSRL